MPDTPSSTRLDADLLLTEACRIAGLDDFGDDSFREGLGRFVTAARDEGQLSASGIEIIAATTVRFLVNRLRLVADLERHPQILDERLAPPIIIMGLPRTGTTKLHRMIAVDARLKSLKAWQIMNPAPFPGGEDASGRDPRIAAAEQTDAMLEVLVPELLAGHPVRANEVDEESVTLMEMNFDYLLLAMRLQAPNFEAWTKSRPALPIYRHLRLCLQYLQWQMGSDPRPYVLKSPLHLSNLHELIEVFPGATLVHCHRNPVEAAASFMRLAELGRRLCYDQQDNAELGKWVVTTLAEQVAANLRQREALGSRLAIVDVAFKEITRDPFAALDRIYTAHGLELSAATRKAMLDWEAGHPANRFGKFEYRLADYGKSPREVEQAFAAYSQRFAALL